MNEVLKQRVIGALVLVGVAIIFLPSFFKERRPFQVDMTTQIPARINVAPVIIDEPSSPQGIEPAPVPETMFLPESNQVVIEDLEALQAEPAETVPVPQPTKTPSQSVTAPVSTVAPIKSSTSKSEAPASTAKAWVIQVASLRSAPSAKNLRDKLQKRGYRAYIRVVSTNSGSVSRVFIGPKLNKEAALDIKEKVDSLFKVNSLVLIFKP